jgi:ArsR family transcriptional regulator
LDIAKALSDANRVRALMLLTDGPLCVCQIIEMLGLAASTTSKHMSILRQAGLVEADKQGRWMHYRLAGKNAAPQVRKAIQWTVSGLGDDPQIQKDALCRKQRS